MTYRAITWASVVGAAVILTSCDRGTAEDVEKARREAQEEIARIQRDSNEKIEQARREADRKIAEARQEAADKQADAVKKVTDERRSLEEQMRSARRDTKEQYLDYARKRARLLELQAADLQTMPGDAGAPATAERSKQLEDIDARHRRIIGSLDEAGKTGPENWSSTKAKIDKDLNDLEKSIHTIEKSK